MKTKKIVLAAIIAALLVSAMLIAGCIEQVGELTVKKADVPAIDAEGDSGQVPAEMGYVNFKISDGDARTILPVLPVTADVAYYEVVFVSDDGLTTLYFPTSDDGHTSDGRIQLSSSKITSTVALVVGDWDITITAFAASTGGSAFAGWENTVTINTGINNIDAALKGIADGTGPNGTFTWSITLPSDGSTPLFTVTNMNSSGTVTDLTSGISTGTTSLSSGYYLVELNVTKLHYQTMQYVRVLHIYPGLTSSMPAINVPTLVENEFQITFVMGSEAIDNASYFLSPVYVGYANYISSVVPDPIPTDTDKYFAGWYKEIGHTNLFGRILSNSDPNAYPLYASDGTAIFTVTLLSGEQANITGGAAISKAAFLAGSATITLALAAAPDSADWADVTWYVGGHDYNTNDDTFVVKVDGDSTTNSPSINTLFNSASIEITVTATVDGGDFDGVKYSATYVIVVNS